MLADGTVRIHIREGDANAARNAVLAGLVGVEPDELRFTTDERGKPHVEPPIEFSVSHSGDLVLIAAARDRRVGVDVERIRERPPPRRAFSSAEQQGLRTLEAAFRAWTRKEAYLKALGVGLAGGPATVEAGSEGTRTLDGFTIRSFDTRPGYAAAVAAEGEFRLEIEGA